MLLSTMFSGYLQAQHIMQANGKLHYDGHVYTNESISTILASNPVSIVEYKISREWADRAHHRTIRGGIFLGVTVTFALAWRQASANRDRPLTSFFQELFYGALSVGSGITSMIVFATAGGARYEERSHLRSAIDLFNYTQRIGYDNNRMSRLEGFTTSFFAHPTGVGVLMTF